MISFTVSHPPPLSATTRNVPGVGRVKATRYKNWIKANEYIVKLAAGAGRAISGPYALTVQAGKPDLRQRDLDNMLKSLSDLLVRVGAVRDDSDCQRIDIRWSAHHDDVFVQVVETALVEPRGRAAA